MSIDPFNLTLSLPRTIDIRNSYTVWKHLSFNYLFSLAKRHVDLLHLLFMARVGLFLFLFLLFCLRPLDDVDIFTQIKLGQLALEGGLLTDEPILKHYSYQPWVNPGWLWQVVAALLVNSAGLTLLKLSHVALLAASFIALLDTDTRKKNTLRISFEALALAVLPILTSTSVRPQIVAFFLFAITVSILYRTKMSVVREGALFLLFIVWQNCHPSVLTALPALLLIPCNQESHIKHLVARMPIIILSILASLCTPLGFDIFTLSAHNYELSRNIFLITEWYGYFELPLNFLPSFGVCALITIPLIYLGRKSITFYELILFTIYLAATVVAVRFVVFWSLITFVLLQRIFKEQPQLFKISKIVEDVPKSLKRGALAIVFLVLSYSAFYTPQLSAKFPMKCVLSVNKLDREAKLIHEPHIGGLITYFTDRNATVDGRYYLHTKRWWVDYLKKIDRYKFNDKTCVALVTTQESAEP